MSDIIKVNIGKFNTSKSQEEKFRTTLNKSLNNKSPLQFTNKSNL